MPIKKPLPYAQYKETSSEWIPKIPSTWRIGSLKWLSLRFSGGTPDKNKAEYWFDGTIPWLNSGEVNQGVITKPSEFITEEGFKNSSTKWIPVGSVLIALAGQGKTKGMAAYNSIDTTCNQSMAAIVFKREFNSKYFYWFLTSQYRNIRGLASSDGRDGLNLEMIGSIQVPIPSLIEQQSIANFLDQKTAQVDALIEQKEKLLELLTEKRTAIITQAVTKGLDPNVKMKDSGIEWLGEVPEHWDIKKLKYLGRMKSGEAITTLSINEFDEYPVYGGNGLRGFTASFTHSGEFILIGRQGALCGNINYASGKFWASEHAVVFTRNGNVDLLWFGELLRIMNLNQYSISAAQPGLAIDRIASLEIPVPPYSEQLLISRFLEQQNAMERAMSKLNNSIEKLKEYRSSLITSAVTGQIDVRKEKV